MLCLSVVLTTIHSAAPPPFYGHAVYTSRSLLPPERRRIDPLTISRLSLHRLRINKWPVKLVNLTRLWLVIASGTEQQTALHPRVIVADRSRSNKNNQQEGGIHSVNY